MKSPRYLTKKLSFSAFFLGLTLGLTSLAMAKEASFITYNAGLAEGHVRYAHERIGPVIEVLKKTTADVTCMQEVWKSEDRDQIIGALKKEYPYVAYFDNKMELKPRCSIIKLAPALACMKKNCTGGDTSGDSLACGLEHCSDGIYGLGGDCFSCLSHYFPITSSVNAAAKCLARGPKYVFEGQNGLLLLSKHPIKTSKIHSFPSTLVKRDVIEAVIDLPSMDTPKVFCTHLQNKSSAPYFGAYTDWKNEQNMQIKKLVDLANSDPLSVEKTLIMGDMNTGPAGANIDGEFPENFNEFALAGFASIYPATGGVDCTWCGNKNPIAGNQYRNIIDHVFVKASSLAKITTVNTEIFAQEFYQLRLNIDEKDGGKKEVSSPASDHFGLKVSFFY